jgi:hypothetical protein
MDNASQQIMGVTYVSRNEALALVALRVEDAEVVLDLGSGILPQPFVKKPYVHICVDAHRPYLDCLKRKVADDPKYVFINARWDQVMPMLPDKSVDTVFALDFIEHLEKADAQRMIREAERVARQQIVVHTPRGFFPQSYDDPNKPDRWGMDGGYWQTHRSGWDFDDFGDDWEFICSPDFVDRDENNQLLAEPIPAFWAILNLSSTAARRYDVIEDKSAWAYFKKTLEQGLPSAAFSGLRSVWARVRHMI